MVSLKQALKSKLTKKQLSLLPKSFDLIGSIAIFSSFPDELRSKEKLIGETLIKLNKNIKTVAKKTKIHSGPFRTRKIKILAGKKTKKTLYKESGCIFKLNAETCYFSPRLSTERLRISSLIKPKESILVMFSGIAPYPIIFSKHSKAKEIYGIEINPSCHKFALENLKLNKITNVKLILGDVKKIKLNKKFDRIIMPLPSNALDFLGQALKLSKKGTIIHLYGFQRKEDIKESIKKIKKQCKAKILKKVLCGQSSPRKFRICIDFQVLQTSSFQS